MQGGKGFLVQPDHRSHEQILKSTGIVGGAQVVSVAIRILRTKVIAVLLGPLGVGALGLYQATLDLVRSVTGLGLSFSAVRDVAEAAGSADGVRISRTITVLRRWVWLTGVLGAVLVVLLRTQFSQRAFGDLEHASDFVLLAAVPLMAAVGGGQMALLRGLRRVGDMARAGVLGAIAGLCITLPIYWIAGMRGIVPAMLVSAAAELLLSWYFARRVRIQKATVTLRETLSGGAGMIRLGLLTAIGGLTTTGTMYLTRLLIAGRLGVDGVGQFQAAWNLSSVYVGLVLGAMAADYYPRLAAVSADDAKVCRLVNEQTEVGLLLSGPVIVGMICLMDVVVSLLYSARFGESIDILLWQTLGNLFKVISWPMGFVFLAKGRGSYFVLTEFIWDAVFLGTTWILWNRVGLSGAGIAFAGGYVVFTGAQLLISNRVCGFVWSRKSLRHISAFTAVTVLALATKGFLEPPLEYIGLVLFAGACAYSYRELNRIVDVRQMLMRGLARIRGRGGREGKGFD